MIHFESVYCNILVEDEYGVICKPRKIYPIISIDTDTELVTIEAEDKQWLSISVDDPSFILFDSGRSSKPLLCSPNDTGG